MKIRTSYSTGSSSVPVYWVSSGDHWIIPSEHPGLWSYCSIVMSVPCSGSGSVKAGGCDEGPGICSVILTLVSVILVIATLPFSLLLVVKVVQVQAEERYPSFPHWARVRNTRGPWYSASGCCWPEAPGAPAYSSSCPVSTCTRRLTWGPRPSTSLHKRFVCAKGTEKQSGYSKSF